MFELPWTSEFQLEICSVANGATKKEIGRAKEYIVKQLGLETGQSVEMGTIHAGDFMVCFFPIKLTVLVLLFIYRECPYCSDANIGFICIISTIVINISLNLICRGVSAPILECLIIQLKLPQKLLKRQNSLI